MIFSDRQLLFELREQTKDVYEGELSFFISDPLLLNDITEKVENLTSIDWNNHIVQKNDFKFSKISAQLRTIQDIVTSFIVIVAVLGIVILMLMMTWRIRGRIKEAGIFAFYRQKQKRDYRAICHRSCFCIALGLFVGCYSFHSRIFYAKYTLVCYSHAGNHQGYFTDNREYKLSTA